MGLVNTNIHNPLIRYPINVYIICKFKLQYFYLSSDDMMNSVIQKRSLADEVAEKIRFEIHSGKYAAGEQLPIEADLMKTFGVGRSSVREAVRILANSGLLRVQQGVGTFVEAPAGIMEPFVQRLKRADAEDLNEVRHLLEMKLAEKAALNHTAADLVNMQSHLDKRRQAADEGSIEGCIQADIDFHLSIAKASGNEILADLYQAFAMHLKNWFAQLYPDTAIYKATMHLHEALYESIKAGDGHKAWAAAAKILDN